MYSGNALYQLTPLEVSQSRVPPFVECAKPFVLRSGSEARVEVRLVGVPGRLHVTAAQAEAGGLEEELAATVSRGSAPQSPPESPALLEHPSDSRPSTGQATGPL